MVRSRLERVAVSRDTKLVQLREEGVESSVPLLSTVNLRASAFFPIPGYRLILGPVFGSGDRQSGGKDASNDES